MGNVCGLDLFWIPLGAGTSVVPRCGRAYERLVAVREGRAPQDLYHAAMTAQGADGVRFAVEVGPEAGGPPGRARHVVAHGPVGSALLGRSRWFRYEVRCWPDGVIPDLAHAVGGPVHLSGDEADVARVLAVLPTVPTPVWGRDDLHAGEMWNSNSVIAWSLAVAGLADRAGGPPAGGRAPGWDAGLVVAARQSRAAA